MNATLALLDIGPLEFVLLAAAAVLLFGGDLPDVARKAARFVGRMRAMSSDLTQDLRRPPPEFRMPDELRRPPELDLPTDLGLSPQERSLSASPPISEASWRPKTSPPDPEAFPAPGSVETDASSGSAAHPAEPAPPSAHDAAEQPCSPAEPGADAPRPERREDQPPEASKPATP
ncbi:MAG: hypothetical protein DRQ55_06150 [Planctomycetota bacterium]|nr:MAG: hypothetical protein DRQ55_06150 [Planctomycetota bacterium]